MLRNRWFLFGYKKSEILNVQELRKLSLPIPSSVVFQPTEEVAKPYVETFSRTISPDICSFKQSKEQISLIGNAVCVPQVRMAWNELINRSCLNFDSVSLGACMVGPDHAGAKTNKSDLANGYWSEESKFVLTPVFKPNIIRPVCKLILDPNSCPPPLKRSPNQTLPVLLQPLIQTRFMTPVYTEKGAARVLTKRTAHDHPTQIKFEVKTKNRFDPLNPMFYESLFGFPPTFSSI